MFLKNNWIIGNNPTFLFACRPSRKDHHPSKQSRTFPVLSFLFLLLWQPGKPMFELLFFVLQHCVVQFSISYAPVCCFLILTLLEIISRIADFAIFKSNQGPSFIRQHINFSTFSQHKSVRTFPLHLGNLSKTT